MARLSKDDFEKMVNEALTPPKPIKRAVNKSKAMEALLVKARMK